MGCRNHTPCQVLSNSAAPKYNFFTVERISVFHPYFLIKICFSHNPSRPKNGGLSHSRNLGGQNRSHPTVFTLLMILMRSGSKHHLRNSFSVSPLEADYSLAGPSECWFSFLSNSFNRYKTMSTNCDSVV